MWKSAEVQRFCKFASVKAKCSLDEACLLLLQLRTSTAF